MDMTIHIKLRVKNFGRTPAYVTDVILTPVREYEGVWAGQLTLHVIGFVDYVDAFRVRHRGGYARTYTPDLQNNLTFATDNSAHNFDVVRSPAVGRDWTLSW